jgi:hypothetical protein
MAYVRFPIPAFDHLALRGLDWAEPRYLSASEIAAKASDAAARGAFATKPDAALLDQFDISGEHCHALLCRAPAGGRLVGRSNSWWLQRALVLDSLDPASAQVIADWRTPRPVNTRFGPEDGIETDGRPLYVISSHGLAGKWVGNRTLVQDVPGGFRVLGTAKDGTANFHEFCLTFTWGA